MSTVNSIVAQLNEVLDSANTKMETEYTNITDTVDALIDGFGQVGSGESVELSSITITPTGEMITETADDGCGWNEVIVDGDKNLKPQNIAEGIEIYGKVGTLKVTASDTFPVEYEEYKAIADALYLSNVGQEPPTTLMVLETNGHITFGYFLSNWEVTAYNSETTDFCAIGWRRVSFHKGEDAPEFSDFSAVDSTGGNYIKNIRYCGKSTLYYSGSKIYPHGGIAGVATMAARGITPVVGVCSMGANPITLANMTATIEQEGT